MFLRFLVVPIFLLFCFEAFAQNIVVPQNLNQPQSQDSQALAPSSQLSPELSPDQLRYYKNDVEVKNLQNSLSMFEPRKPTPSRFFSADLSMPEKFASTNNLAKKTGSFYRAFGEIIFVQGTITDSFGVPIEGATIEIWQTNAAGKYHTLLEPDSEFIDQYFSMSGRTISDNLGNYHFITIMPGATTGRAPHLNVNIYHTKFGKLETEMYFANHPYNKTDFQYSAYEENDRKLVTAQVRHSDMMNTRSIKLCTFNIVMRGTQQYKRY